MAESLPDSLQLPTRDETRDQYLRQYRIRDTASSTNEGTQPYIDASTVADAMVPIYHDAKIIGDDAALDNKTRAALITYGKGIGLAQVPLPATGASGFVQISASSGGGVISFGQECRGGSTNLRFQCASTGLYGDGALVPVVAVDVGPLTNLAAGTVLKWTAPPPGIGQTCTVFEQANGAGLEGGRNEETDDEIRDRIRDRQANPPASGNDGAYQDAVENISGLAVQKSFTIPCVQGPGTTGILFTMRNASPGGGRRPNAIQLTQVRSQLLGAFPADDGQFVCSLLEDAVSLCLKVTWSPTVTGWADLTPWPVFLSGNRVHIDGGVTIGAMACRVSTTDTTVAPAVGQVLGLYDPDTATFKRKQILTVTVVSAGQSWDLTFDGTNNASDPNFVPAAGALVSPWSDSLDILVTPILQYFDTLGPGEQFSSFFDVGLRQRRNPPSPQQWAYQVTSRILAPLYSLTAIADVSVQSPALPYTTPVGSPGVSSYLPQLGDLAVFAQ